MSKSKDELFDVVARTARAALSLQRADGSLPAGENGPWKDRETPVRNTGYWLITFLKAFDITGDLSYLRAAEKAVLYLTSGPTRPHGRTFMHRISPFKDSCNGLIGQAWTIEALTVAGHKMARGDLHALAEEVVLIHPFNTSLGLWRTVDIDGRQLTLCPTFNQQLWFAAIVGQLGKASQANHLTQMAAHFLDNLEHHLRTFQDGLIHHGLYTAPHYLARAPYLVAKDQLKHARAALLPPQRYLELSVGYHSFNLYALALMKEVFPEHRFWTNQKLGLVMAYRHARQYRLELKHNRFAFSYNPTGIEIAFALNRLKPDTEEEQRRWLTQQFSNYFDWRSGLMSLQSLDPMTSAARIYEVTRLRNYPLTVSS